MLSDAEHISAESAHLIWAILGLIFTVTIVIPYLYERRKR